MHNAVAYVCGGMDLLQSSCYPITQNFTSEFPSSALLDAALDGSNYLVNVVFPYGKLSTRLSDGTKNFVSIKDLRTAITFDHQSKVVFQPFASGEPPVAVRAMSPSPNVVVVLSWTGFGILVNAALVFEKLRSETPDMRGAE